MSTLPPLEVFAKTIYAEARGESVESQIWVAWVIKNRARMNRGYWGGNTIKGVCLAPSQFECWNGRNDIVVNEQATYSSIYRLAEELYFAPDSADPTGGADHYNNPAKEGYPDWTRNCRVVRVIGEHTFYKEL